MSPALGKALAAVKRHLIKNQPSEQDKEDKKEDDKN